MIIGTDKIGLPLSIDIEAASHPFFFFFFFLKKYNREKARKDLRHKKEEMNSLPKQGGKG